MRTVLIPAVLGLLATILAGVGSAQPATPSGAVVGLGLESLDCSVDLVAPWQNSPGGCGLMGCYGFAGLSEPEPEPFICGDNWVRVLPLPKALLEAVIAPAPRAEAGLSDMECLAMATLDDGIGASCHWASRAGLYVGNYYAYVYG